MSFSYSKHTLTRGLHFRKWANKKFAIFKTLKSYVVISVLSVAYLVSVPVISLAFETDTSSVKIKYNIEEVEVSAQRAPTLYSNTLRVVTVLTAREIEAAPVTSLNEFFEYVAGLDIRQRGADETQADISARGGTFDQTLILLNGINLTDPQTGHYNLDIPVSLDQIERVEILEGPAARVYGPNAFAGAINIVTKMPANSEITASATVGSFGFLSPSLSGDFVHKRMRQSLSANYKRSDGYIANTDYSISNLFYNTNFENPTARLTFQAGFTSKEFGANSFYTPKYPNQFEETKAYFTSLRVETKTKIHFTPTVYWRRHTDVFKLFRDNPPTWYANHNYHLTNCYGLNLNTWARWKFGKTALGAEYRAESIMSNVLGEILDKKVKVNGHDAWYTKSKSREILSLFAEHTFFVEKLAFSTGVMVSSLPGNKNPGVFPGADLSYSLNSNTKIFTSFNTSLRLPTFTDLYYEGPTNIGNPDLKPEKAGMLETGLKWNRKQIKIDWVLFVKEGRNSIDWTRKQDSEKWQPRNLTLLKSAGTEIKVDANLQELKIKWLPDVVKISYLYLKLQKDNEGFISYYVLDYLRNKLTLTLNKRFGHHLNVNLQSTFQQREGTYTSFENGAFASEKPYLPFCIFDSKAIYNWKKIDLFCSVSNIFGYNYYDFGNLPQPGRSVKAGVKYRIGFN